MQNCQWQPIKYCLIYVFRDSPFEMVGRIRSSFQMKCTTRSTCQMKCSDIPPKIRWCVQTRMLLGQLVTWSAQIYPPTNKKIRWCVQMRRSFSDEVFMFSCCIGNTSSWTLSNLCRLHPIDHRCMEYSYTTVSHIASMHIYQGPPPIDHRCMVYHYTTEVSHIAECTYTKVPPPPIDHRSMEYHYTTSLSDIAECTCI